MNFDPSDPNTQRMIGGVIRAVLAAVGGSAVFSSDQTSQLAGALAVIVTIAWSMWSKHTATKQSHATVVKVAAAVAAKPADASKIVEAARAGKF